MRLATLHYLQYVSQTGATWRHLSNQSSSLVPIVLVTDSRSASQWGNRKFGNWSKRTLNSATSVIYLKVDCGRLQDWSQSKIVRSPASIAQPVFKHRRTKVQHWWKNFKTNYLYNWKRIMQAMCFLSPCPQGNSLSAIDWKMATRGTISHFITQKQGLLFFHRSLAVVGSDTTALACQSTLKADGGLYFIVNCSYYHARHIRSHSASVWALTDVPVSQPH